MMGTEGAGGQECQQVMQHIAYDGFISVSWNVYSLVAFGLDQHPDVASSYTLLSLSQRNHGGPFQGASLVRALGRNDTPGQDVV